MWSVQLPTSLTRKRQFTPPPPHLLLLLSASTPEHIAPSCAWVLSVFPFSLVHVPDPSYDHLIRTLIDDYEQSVSPRSQEGRYDDRGSDSGRRSTKEGVMGRGQTGRRMTENLARDPSRAPQQPVSPSTSETSSDVQSRERLSRRDVTSPEFDRNARRPSKASRPRRSSGEQVLLDHGMVDPVQRDLGKEHTKAIVMNPLAKNKTGKPSTRSGHLKSAVLPTHTYDCRCYFSVSQAVPSK